MDKTNDEVDSSTVRDIEEGVRQWFPRDTTRLTNWLYRVDAIRPTDIRKMDDLWNLVHYLYDLSNQFLMWVHVLTVISDRSCTLLRESCLNVR